MVITIKMNQHRGQIQMTILNTLSEMEQRTFGTARLLIGHTRLSRAKKAGITTSQLRSIYDDLGGIPDSAIDGFIEIGNKLVEGKIDIPSTAFGLPKNTSKKSK